MNDPNKRIDVNISSLLSLKAELLRKQDEVNKAKEKLKIEDFVPKKGGTKKSKEPRVEECVKDNEDLELINRSRQILEAKSKYYDKMVASGGKLNSDDNCLVLFNKKKQDNKTTTEYNSSSEDLMDGEDDDDVPKDDKWVEYIDCLGRTRICLQRDLDFFKKKDSQLAETLQPRIELNQNAPMWMIDTQGNNNNNNNDDKDNIDDSSEMMSIVSKHDQMKSNWEKKEEENIYKENVHYQDVFFDEARMHGVGYYMFSTEEEERIKQQKALDDMRKKTLDFQKKREIERDTRRKIVLERVKAAKNRQRARLGLPPIEEEPEPEQQLFDTKEEEARKKREAKKKRKKEKMERRREEERRRHIRPWDKNKPGVSPNYSLSDSEDEWNYKPTKEPMSQEQWNEMKREERIPEFSPIPKKPSKRPFHVPKPIETECKDNDVHAYDENAQHSLYFTTKKSPKKTESYSHSDLTNECDQDKNGERVKSRSAEIPPPLTFEYYGPTSAKRSKPPSKANIENSVEAGLRYIRNQSYKNTLSTKPQKYPTFDN